MAIGGSNLAMAARTIAHRSCAVAILLAAMWSWADQPPATEPGPGADRGVDNGVNPYSKLSNEQLGALAGTFDDLDRDQRRWFLTEVRKRMSAKGEGPRIQVDQGDPFGRVVSKVAHADQGSREPPNRVGALPADKESTDATKVYGTGLQSQGEETADASTPTQKSEDPSKPNR